MTATASTAWRSEFGLGGEKSSPGLLLSKDEVSGNKASFAQAHLVRRAFDVLEIDAVYCDRSGPLVYFKSVSKVNSADVLVLHRRFWNHGGAPILAVIAPTEVQIYSGLARPSMTMDASGRPRSWVTNIQRATVALREFLPAVESGAFFHQHAKSFDSKQRVDRALLDNLQATREELAAASSKKLNPDLLDALLCRLVFACYLFDREVIGHGYLRELGLGAAKHLRDVLAIRPRAVAKQQIYRLFHKLGEDFNGDLFSDDLAAEAEMIGAAHLDLLEGFFRATDVRQGQASFWPYDFGIIPIETISAIYERFLKPSERKAGSFYTPRFLAELVLDLALTDTKSLLGRRYLDPACGSGIFLVGLFNRLADEWTLAHPNARNDQRSRELMKLLQDSLFGVDINGTACRITAFSLYLAYLDQLSPRDIQALQKKRRALPNLVMSQHESSRSATSCNIWRGDFFSENAGYPTGIDLVVGNPPWGSTAVEGTAASDWCIAHNRQIPDMQIATAFCWKAAEHVGSAGAICLVLPHGTIFNHSPAAVEFQRSFFEEYTISRVVNLADYQRFLFEGAGHPAVVISYGKQPPSRKGSIDYWSPKVDWTVAHAEMIAVGPNDRTEFSLQDVLKDLSGKDAPQIWKRHLWATQRDRRLLDRLSTYPRLSDQVRRAREKAHTKPWLMAVGYQPVGENDDPKKAETIELPSNLFVEASSPHLDLFLLAEDCDQLRGPRARVRSGSNKSTEVFHGPHVLVAKGFTSTAFASFDVSFQDAVRGICGPKSDEDLLIFLTAYLRSPLARYFLFHTSANWGVSRQEIHVEEMLRLPFPLPLSHPRPERAKEIVRDVARIVKGAAKQAARILANREELVGAASASIEPMIDEYFDLLPNEQTLVRDTVSVVIPSVRPTRQRRIIPTIAPSMPSQRNEYTRRLCETLNEWGKKGRSVVRGYDIASNGMGVAIAILEKSPRGSPAPQSGDDENVLAVLNGLARAATNRLNTLELVRGIKAFEGNRLYVVKPIGRRFWTQSAALNDADEIAGSILMHSARQGA